MERSEGREEVVESALVATRSERDGVMVLDKTGGTAVHHTCTSGRPGVHVRTIGVPFQRHRTCTPT